MVEHKSVMLEEALSFLQVEPGRRFIDATVGGGGHIEAILKSGGEVLGIDQDPTSLDITRKRLKNCSYLFGCYSVHPSGTYCVHRKGVFKLVQGNFANLLNIASCEGFKRVDGILFDLGFASFQLEDSRRGLSFLKEEPLDMRLDPKLNVTASDLINSLPETELVHLFWNIGEEPLGRLIAHAIIEKRFKKRIETTGELKELIERVYLKKGRIYRPGKIHPATKVFMALRIVVNSEFENLKEGLQSAIKILAPKGRLVVISFHSGEDRIVKEYMRELEKNQEVIILTKKPLVPCQDEVNSNPRSRSAKLRAIEVI